MKSIPTVDQSFISKMKILSFTGLKFQPRCFLDKCHHLFKCFCGIDLLLFRKKTIYCDRIIKDEKSCKIWGPRLKHKLQAQNKKVVEEFDRAKQKMYKRYKRATDPNKKASPKDLTYQEYYEWLDRATQARDDYLAGKLSAVKL